MYSPLIHKKLRIFRLAECREVAVKTSYIRIKIPFRFQHSFEPPNRKKSNSSEMKIPTLTLGNFPASI